MAAIRALKIAAIGAAGWTVGNAALVSYAVGSSPTKLWLVVADDAKLDVRQMSTKDQEAYRAFMQGLQRTFAEETPGVMTLTSGPQDRNRIKAEVTLAESVSNKG